MNKNTKTNQTESAPETRNEPWFEIYVGIGEGEPELLGANLTHEQVKEAMAKFVEAAQ